MTTKSAFTQHKPNAGYWIALLSGPLVLLLTLFTAPPEGMTRSHAPAWECILRLPQPIDLQ